MNRGSGLRRGHPDGLQGLHPDNSGVDTLESHIGERVHFDPDPGQFPQGVVGQLTEVSDVAPGDSAGTVTAENSTAIRSYDFPLSQYTGAIQQVLGVHEDADEQS